MLLSFERRFLFVANTKTASTSIETVLRPHATIVRAETPRRKHVGLSVALEEYRGDFARAGVSPGGVLKFGVMRDPIDWITSWYRYRRGNAVESPLPADMDFAAFWTRADWNIKSPKGVPYLQRRLFCEGETTLADVIIPYPRLSETFARICKGLGIAVGDLPQENRSRLRETEGLSPELREEMRDFYAADYALWDRLDEINAPALARLEEGDYAPR
ncbi:hypothetical protein [Palleronia sp. LCG004]|uniref:hypothetical protein n=1 Tax=Palleronia sp. LCG004 TaxID=3079304 RepID=UPI002942426B|nr:hypothetical protein [Palleronia sp. LCG004]WOI58360.1 hypothetical protein RVY76_18430 [Palleronia sp. LCG004]